MLASRENWEDVRKYFENTFIKIADFGDEIVHVDRVTSERMEVTNPLTKEPAWIMLNTRPYELSFVLPRKTVYQMDNRAAMLSRIPARMWKKGLTGSNTQFQVLETSSWQNGAFTIDFIVKFVNKPTYLSYAEAVAGFKDGSLISAALTKRVSVTITGNVYIDNVLVARIEQGTITTRTVFVNTLTPVFPNLLFKVLK